MKTLIRPLVAVVAASLALPAIAGAADYPLPENPGKPKPRPGGAATLKVCKKKGCKYKTIQKAVDAARAGDKIRVANGTYRESVRVEGARKDGISIVGNAKDPYRVMIDAKGELNGIAVNAADDVKLQGLSARRYKGNGFFAVNVNGYTMDRLVATGLGVYGLYAFNSKGGEMTNSQAYYHTDAGFYIGQTPYQPTKRVRTIVNNVSSWGNVLGWSGTNMRYVTITKSFFFNNGTGIVPNTLVSEKYPPDEDNTIVNNDIFWNNYNYWKGAPFDLDDVSPGVGVPYPVGIGILLFGGRRHDVSRNRVFGNWGAGMGLIEQLVLKNDPDRDEQLDKAKAIGERPWELQNNRFVANVMGNRGKDLNGRDLTYDGSGSGNCFTDNRLSGGSVGNLPDFSSTAFPECNDGGAGPANTFNLGAQLEALGWAVQLGDTKEPGGTIPRAVSKSYRGYKPFGQPSGKGYTVWTKAYKPPVTPK